MASYIFKPFPRLKRWSSRQCPVNCSAISSSLLWQRGSRNFANCRGSRSLQQSATVQPLHPLSAAPALGLAPVSWLRTSAPPVLPPPAPERTPSVLGFPHRSPLLSDPAPLSLPRFSPHLARLPPCCPRSWLPPAVVSNTTARLAKIRILT